MLVIFRPLVTQAAAQKSQHGEQKQWQTTSKPKRRYSHPQCGTRPTTRDEKQIQRNTHIDKTSKKTPPNITAQTLQEAIAEK